MHGLKMVLDWISFLRHWSSLSWCMPFIVATWRDHFVGEHFTRDVEHYRSWRRASSPSFHVVAWIPIKRIGNDWGTQANFDSVLVGGS